MYDQPGPSVVQRVVRFIRRFFLWIVIVVALAVVAGAFEGGRYSVYSAHPELSSQEEANDILRKVGDLMQLPGDETPTMATINDAASAKENQPFLVNAENGDIVIVYPNAAKALLYRPSNNKIINVGPVETSGTAWANVKAPASTPTETPSDDATNTKAE